MSTQPPKPDDPPERWKEYWKAQGQPWRTEPEIDPKRQEELAKCRAIVPDIEEGIYPFKGMKLSRADVEWLLSTHESGGIRGPVDWSDKSQRERKGLDLRGANLRGADLHGLPLARIRDELDWSEKIRAIAEQKNIASMHFEDANLSNAHLDGALLIGVCLDRADLRRTYLEQANLSSAHLEDAILIEAHLEQANLSGAYLERATIGMSAHLEGIDLSDAHLERTILYRTHLEGADFYRAHLEKAYLREAHLEGTDLRRAHLEGADLIGTYLEGADLRGTHLEGKVMSNTELERIQQWKKGFPQILPPADLRLAFFDAETRLERTILGDKSFGFVSLADVHWSDVNLAVVEWSKINMLGDEQQARQKKYNTGKTKEKKVKHVRLSECKDAVRANRQLAVVLRDQGLNEEADHFAYRAQKLEQVIWRWQKRPLKYILSWFLYLLVGYGYQPWRGLAAYFLIIGVFARAYYVLGQTPKIHLSCVGAVIFSITAFHGRGFFLGGDLEYDSWITILGAIEAVFGLLIEFSFIATFTQRFFGR
jgi:uncharacterized protein YjbI with pentapeptide repeats